jgi:hypothetical protein
MAFASGCSSPADNTAVSQPAAQIAQPAPRPTTEIAAARIIAADLPPLPDGLAGAAKSPEVVRAAYTFAAEHPEVLKYIPCICGCERSGHQGNDMCFVAGRNGAGKVTAWESHGMDCEVCLDIATDSMRMHNSGASVEAIRKFVDEKYVRGGNHTPTPMPPHRGGQH